MLSFFVCLPPQHVQAACCGALVWPACLFASPLAIPCRAMLIPVLPPAVFALSQGELLSAAKSVSIVYVQHASRNACCVPPLAFYDAFAAPATRRSSFSKWLRRPLATKGSCEFRALRARSLDLDWR
jgi:hypothetical protein